MREKNCNYFILIFCSSLIVYGRQRENNASIASARTAASNLVFNECILPEKAMTMVPESAILTELQQFEYRIDQLVSEKRQRMRQLLTSPKSVCYVYRELSFNSFIFCFH